MTIFWKGNDLMQELSLNGNLYPNLFAHSLADVHGYSASGKLFKTNCYSTHFDLISGKGNTAAVFKNFSRRLAVSVVKSKSGKETLLEFKNCYKEMDDYILEVINRIRSAELMTGGVRSEFRVQLADLFSLAQALDTFFSIDNIKRLTMVFETHSICRLAHFYVAMLYKQMSANILSLINRLARNEFQTPDILNGVTTISILESLLTATLFSGLTYSYAGKLVWNKSVVGSRSLELMKYIRTLDRPRFGNEFFTDNVLKISGTDEILNTIFGKILRTPVFQFPPIGLIIQFYDENLLDDQKSEILWKIYFQELNSNAFIAESGPRWKLESLNRDVILSLQQAVSFRSAVGSIFNFESFSINGSWKQKYYMKLANEWLNHKSNSINIHYLQMHLVQAIRNLGIEHIHYAGEDRYNACPSRHIKLNLEDVTDTERRTMVVDIPRILHTPSEEEIARQRRERMLEIRNESAIVQRWLRKELESLFQGVTRYGAKRWKQILQDRNLEFGRERTARSLGNKWTSLVREKKVIYDLITQRWSVSEQYTDELPRFEYNAFRSRRNVGNDHQHQVVSPSPQTVFQPSLFDDSGSEDSVDSRITLDFDTFDYNDHEGPSQVLEINSGQGIHKILSSVFYFFRN